MIMAMAACMFFKKQIWVCLPSYMLSIVLGAFSLAMLFLKGGLITNIILVVCAVSVYLTVLISTQILKPNELRGVVNALRTRHCEVNG
jgi:hypothetical protein